MSEEKQITPEAVERLGGISKKILSEIAKKVVGQERVLKELLITVFSGTHCLIEGVPGLAKTLMIKTLGEALDMDFSRIQFTPDLMPSDITGAEIIRENMPGESRSFEFIKGPIFTNLLLADEINRTPPKTQAALLQAMQEYCVTAGGDHYNLERPFFVMATQNPVEQEGTYPLPEAQLDRFMFRVFIDYPSEQDELEIIKLTTSAVSEEISPVISRAELAEIPLLIRSLPVSDHVAKYAVKLVRKTRPGNENAPEFIKEWVSWGAGPRAAQNLILGAKTNAVLRGAHNVATMDVRAVADPVLNHRIMTNFNAEAQGISSRDVIKRLIEFIKE